LELINAKSNTDKLLALITFWKLILHSKIAINYNGIRKDII